MNNSISERPSVPDRLRRVSRILQHRYCNSPFRNAIVARKALRPAERFVADCRRFAIFFVPGWDIVNGGTMSICSIAMETQKLLGNNGVGVGVCTAYGQPRMLRYTKFENNVELFAFEDLLTWFPSGSEVLIHVPELLVARSIADHAGVYRARSDLKWRFNILLQNVKHTPTKEAVNVLKQLGVTTITVAHKASTDVAEDLGCPVHYLSWFISAEDFRYTEYSSKKKLMVISQDFHPAKADIVQQMKHALPDHRLIEIRKMTYQQYKEVIRDAKFTFTFGEGLDGYFVESIFSGAIGLALFAEQYFTSDYRGLPGVFSSANAAKSDVADFLKNANNEVTFADIAKRQYDLVAKTFRREAYQNNLKTFYARYFTEWLAASDSRPS